MSVSKWAYDPDKCDGDYCPGDCDNCDNAEYDSWPEEPEEPNDLEMGFDPYLGCYTDDC